MRDFLVSVFGAVIGIIVATLLRFNNTFGYLACVLIFVYLSLYLFSSRIQSKQSIETEYGYKRPPIAYKVDLYISANPKSIFNIEFKDQSEEYWFIHKIVNDPEVKLDKEDSFFGNNFHFTLIRDESTGLSLVYDAKEKEFVDEVEIDTHFISCNAEKLKQKYDGTNPFPGGRVIIDGGAIGYRDKIAPGGGMDEPFPGAIPTDWIIDTLTRLRFCWGNPMHAIKKFPTKLQGYLDKEKIEYDKSNVNDLGLGIKFNGEEMKNDYYGKIKKATNMELYDQTLYFHQFKSKYLIVSIAMKFMKKDDIGIYG